MPFKKNWQQSPLWQALSLLLNAARPERRHFILGVIWLSLAALLEISGPWMAARIIDDYLIPHRAGTQQIILLLCASLVAGALASWLRYLQLVRLAGLAMRSVQRLRERVFEHVLGLPMAFFDQAITGQLVSRVTNDTEAVKALYVQVLFVILDSGIVLLGTLLAMAWLDWRLMLIVALLIPAVFLIVWLYQRWSAPAVMRARQLRSDINAQIAESIGGMALLQTHNAGARYQQRFANTNRAMFKARMQEIRANAWLLRPALDYFHIVLLACVIFSFGLRPVEGLQIGVLYAFIAYISRVIEPLIQITMQFSQLQQSVIASARVNTLLQEAQTGVKEDAPKQAIHSGAIHLQNIQFAYQPGQPIIQNLNLTIPGGAFFGIVGHTGSGKSTLLNLLLRFYAAQSGQILIDQQDLASIGNQDFRALVALVPQDPFILADSIHENIDMGRGLSQEAIEAAARAAKIHDFILTLDQDYQTNPGESGGRLSTGQKQLIAIARALAGQPKILFLDEATAHIDSETEQVVQQALNELRGKVTLVAIAHRLSTIRNADQIIVLNHGRIAESGQHEQLMQIDNGIYQRLYLLQQLTGQDSQQDSQNLKDQAAAPAT
jgi:ATP-binding cassette, subfamily B, multidrug efflux pump